MEHFIRTYGYIGIIVSTFFGAEEGVILSGFLAGQGLLSLPTVILASAFGGSLGDQVYFYLALRYGEPILNRWSRLRKSLPVAGRLIEKYGSVLVLASRFLIGIRIAVSVLFGLFKMPPFKYSALNFMSALIWASFYGLFSYRFGQAILAWMPQSRHMILWFMIAILLTTILIKLWPHRLREY